MSKTNEKMYAVLRENGKTVEIDTEFLMNNQYNTVEDTRIYDTDILRIINDKRIGLYCCSKKQGTYEEVQEAIDRERAKIENCVGCDGSRCFWYQIDKRLVDNNHRQERIENGKLIVDSTDHTEWSLKCRHKEDYNGKCVYDIDEKPILFTEKNYCFFVEHPNGLPDNSDFVKWLQTNHEKCNIVPCWSDMTLENCSILRADVKLGSYILTIRKNPIKGLHFKIHNARDQVKFAYDFKNKKFITTDGIGYKVSSHLYKRWKKDVITCWDKFSKLWSEWVELYEAEQNN